MERCDFCFFAGGSLDDVRVGVLGRGGNYEFTMEITGVSAMQ